MGIKLVQLTLTYHDADYEKCFPARFYQSSFLTFGFHYFARGRIRDPYFLGKRLRCRSRWWPWADTNTDCNTDTGANSYANCHAPTNIDTNTHPNTDAYSCTRTRWRLRQW